MRAASSEPRQGRKIVAQGVSPGLDGPHTVFGTPLPHGRERGAGGEGASLTHGLEAVKKSTAVILSVAKDLRSYLFFQRATDDRRDASLRSA